MKILHVVDKRDWILEDIAKQIAKHLPEHQFEILYGHESSKEAFEVMEDQYDLIHFIAWPFITMWDVKPKKAIMSVCSWRNWDIKEPWFDIQEAMKRCIETIAVGRKIAQELKCSYIPDGIDISLFKPRNFTVGFVGVIDEYKGFHLVRDACKNTKSDLKVATDFVKDEMPYFYKEVDVVILASVKEGYSAVIAECLAMNKPIITTAEGDFFDKSIIKVDRDVESIAEAIKTFNTRSQIEDRSWDFIINKWKKLYERL